MGRKLPPQFEVKIDKLDPSGEGVGRFDKRRIMVYGALPGETVLVKPLKKNRYSAKAALLKVLKPAGIRRNEREDHYLSCSPWQIMPEEEQLKNKLELSKKLFKNLANKLPKNDVEIVPSNNAWHYRNKMEFSFTEDKQGDLYLALHQRFRFYDYYPLTSCVIAHKRINECAHDIVIEIARRGIRLEQLKNLVLRYSYFEDKCVAVLYVVDPDFKIFSVEVTNLLGWQIIYSDPKSPTTITTAVLKSFGRDYLIEEVSGLKFKFYFDGFFQINPPAFSGLLDFLKENTKPGRKLLDLYSGVGTIGFALADKFEKVISAEFDERAVQAAQDNIKINQLINIKLYTGEAEKQNLRVLLSSIDTLIVDPPRSGMHPRVLKRIIENPPKCFIYVSCNPKTQARDFANLKKLYKVSTWQLFDFYPQTPHVESVIIMKRKSRIRVLLNF